VRLHKPSLLHSSATTSVARHDIAAAVSGDRQGGSSSSAEEMGVIFLPQSGRFRTAQASSGGGSGLGQAVSFAPPCLSWDGQRPQIREAHGATEPREPRLEFAPRRAAPADARLASTHRLGPAMVPTHCSALLCFLLVASRRHYPTGQQRFDLRRSSDAEHHDMMSTQECYSLFPLVTHASTPLRIDDREPAGLSAQRVGDAGPATGHRRQGRPMHPIAIAACAPGAADGRGWR
jgi:hypothetical protein